MEIFTFAIDHLKPTEPLKANWTGTLKNDDLNILCLTTQLLPASYHQKNYSEDCLFLNIFVPGTTLFITTKLQLQQNWLNLLNSWWRKEKDNDSLYSWCWNGWRSYNRCAPGT